MVVREACDIGSSGWVMCLRRRLKVKGESYNRSEVVMEFAELLMKIRWRSLMVVR